MGGMKAVTIWQPQATLIADGHKTIETRSWKPPMKLLGHRIAIHAAKRPMKSVDWSAWLLLELDSRYPGGLRAHEFPLGVVVATAVLKTVGQVNFADRKCWPPMVHCCDPSPHIEVPMDPFGDFTLYKYLWFLEEIEPVTPPIPAIGRQGLWDIEEALLWK